MSTPYKDLEFSFIQHLTLLRVKYFKISYDTVRSKQRYSFLRYYSLVEHHPTKHDYLVLSEKGKMYLRFHRKDNLRFWIPVIISILALLSGYDVYTNPTLEAILQESANIVKTILESLCELF